MLTLRCARTILRPAPWSARLAACFGVAATLSVLSFMLASGSAQADDIAVGGCVGSRYSITCITRWGSYSDPYIRLVPHPQSEAEKALSAEREHKWQARCRPAVVQDAYGVPRYEYAAPGCEFGVTQ